MKYTLPTLACWGLLLVGHAAWAQLSDTKSVEDSVPAESLGAQAILPDDEQATVSALVPPSPNAAALGKYGFVPVSLSTGAPNLDILLYTFRSGVLTLPLSLSYYAGGVKVDELAAWTGLHWTLNGGGAITRVVRDRPDEESYFNRSLRHPEQIKSDDPESLEFIKRAGEDDQYDSEPDQFAFNFMGYAGKFVFDQDGTVRTIPHQKMSVERFYEAQQLRFRITLADGVVYEFGGGNATESSKVFPVGAGCSKNLDDFVETAWYLTRVTHPAGDALSFTYTRSTYQSFEYTSGVQQTLTRVQGQSGCADGSSCAAPGLATCENTMQMNVAILDSIKGEQGSVRLFSTKNRLDGPGKKLDAIQVVSSDGVVKKRFDLTYDFVSCNASFASPVTKDTDRYRMFLASVSESSGEKVHRFTYNSPAQLPPRLSYAQDHWGFFNGRDNTHLVPRDDTYRDASGNPLFEGYGGDRAPNVAVADFGLLNRITYPTGGYTALEWEPHEYYGTTQETSFSQLRLTAEVSLDGGINEVVTDSEAVNVLTTQEVVMEISSRVEGEPDPRHAFSAYSVYDETASEYLISSTRIALGTNQTVRVYLTEGHTYTFNIDASSAGVRTGMNFTYQDQPPTTVTKNIPVGGARIKRTTAHASIGKDVTKDYYYSKKDNLSVSSGTIGRKPVYYDSYTSSRSCSSGEVDCATFNCSYGLLRSNSLTTLYITGKSHIYYRFVTVSGGDDFSNGGEQYEFIINDDTPGKLVFGDQPITETPYTNFGWNHGLEKEVERFQRKSNGTLALVQKTTNNYIRDDRNYTEVPGLVVRKKYDPVCVGDVTVTCDESTVAYRKEYKICDTNHTHQWFLGPGGTRCLAPGADNDAVSIVWTHPCYGKSVGTVLALPYNLEYMDAMEYKNISHWYYLEKATTITYDENENPLTTVVRQYQYDNPEHLQPTQTTTTDSEQRPRVTNYKYATDFTDNTYGSQLLREAHMHRQVLEQITTVDTTSTRKRTTTYANPNGLVVPAIVQDYPTGTDQAQTTKYDYDDRGNVRQKIGPDGVPTAFVWGYNRTLPVARVVGATVSQVEGQLGTDFHAGAGSLSDTQAQTLRNGLKPAQVTTYTYDPLVGITSETDANGRTTTYHYDDLNRLEWIESDEGHVVQKLDYQYAQP